MTLLKLRKAAYVIKNSSTLILPEWFAVLERMAQEAVEQGSKPLSSQMMPRDIAICWNTTYNMLTFTYTYRQAYNELTDNRHQENMFLLNALICTLFPLCTLLHLKVLRKKISKWI